MNVLIVLPSNQPLGGNWTYAERLRRGLQQFGIRITCKAFDQVDRQDYQEATIVHCYNAYATGCHVVDIAKPLNKPLVVTITGTDVNEYLNHPVARRQMKEVIEYASRIVFLNKESKKKLYEVFSNIEEKGSLVDIGIDLPRRIGKQRTEFGFQKEEFIFLLVAGIRSVKRPLAAIEPMKRVYRKYPHVRFALAGPILDEKLFQEVQCAFQHIPFARYIGSIPHMEMTDLYNAVDVALNTSSSEGVSQALLEAMLLGKPILASNVPGNRSLIQDGINGFLYSNEDQFVHLSELLIKDENLRANMGQQAIKTINSHYSLKNELDSFRKLYEQVLQPSLRYF